MTHLSNIKGFENNGAEWPDKHNKTGLNSVSSGVDWVMGPFSLWYMEVAPGFKMGFKDQAENYHPSLCTPLLPLRMALPVA